MKKTITFTLIFVLMMSLCSAAWAAPLRASARDADAQIDQLFQNFSACQQPDKDGTWYYAVTDLDHNGRLELLAVVVPQGRYVPEVNAWELDKNSKLQQVKLNIGKDQHFANILTDSAETRYNKDKDTWYYIVSDFFPMSDSEAYLDRSAFFLKSGVMDYGVLAAEQITPAGSTYTDTKGNTISVEDFNAAGDRYFKDSQKSSTNFEWFTASDAAQRSVFADSYAVFTGDKAPAQTFTASPAYPASYLAVTKNPTTESVLPGDTALFVAGANAYSSLEWVFVAPDGSQYAADGFAALFPASSVSSNSTTLSIGNVQAEMSGWSVYCIFRDSSRTVWTNSARLYVQTEFVIEDMDTIFYAWFSDGSWVCPYCGNVCYGDFCPYCGFDIWVVWYEVYDDDAYIEMVNQYYIDVDDSSTVTYVVDNTDTQPDTGDLPSQDDGKDSDQPSLLDDIENDLLSLFDDKDKDQDPALDDKDKDQDLQDDQDLQNDKDEEQDLQDDKDEEQDLQDDMDDDQDLQDDKDEEQDLQDDDLDDDPDDPDYWLHHKRKWADFD